MANLSTSTRSHLRIIAINDVYELDAFPHFATLVAEERSKEGTLGGPDKVIVTLAGDFVSPSALSSLDKGRGMVDVLNNCGVDFASLGNHEADIAHRDLLDRVTESKFKWINTNFPGLVEQPAFNASATFKRRTMGAAQNVVEHVVMQIGQVQVALIGVCALLPGMDKLPGFPKECMEAYIPCTEAAEAAFDNLINCQKLANFVIPLTHQWAIEDMPLLESTKATFPLVLGGHEHDVMVAERDPATGSLTYIEWPATNIQPAIEAPAGVVRTAAKNQVLIKTGAEARWPFIVDVIWNLDDGSSSSTGYIEPTCISYSKVDVLKYPPNQKVRQICDYHYAAVLALSRTYLTFHIPQDYLPLSTVGGRQHLATMQTMLCSVMRDVLVADCVVVNAGSFRLEKTWSAVDDTDPTSIKLLYSEISDVLPYPTPIQAVRMKGSVVRDTLRFSRRMLKDKPGQNYNAFLHCDDQVVFKAGTSMDPDNLDIVSLGGEAFEPERVYRVGVVDFLFRGLDNVAPLVNWKEANEAEWLATLDTCRPAKTLLIDFFSGLWWRLLPPFDVIDSLHPPIGHVTPDEVKEAYLDVLCGRYAPDQARQEQYWDEPAKRAVANMVDALFSHLDLDDTGTIEHEEYDLIVGERNEKRDRTMDKFLALLRK